MSQPLNIIKEQEPEPWYHQGLRFKCTECGQCCTGAPGYIWVTEKEIQVIAEHLKLSISDFSKKYLRQVNGRYSLIEKPVNFDCIFLENKKCRIYSVRPTQCRTFPWWPRNLHSKEDWEAAAQYCEGIHSDADLVPIEKIQEQLEIAKTHCKPLMEQDS